MFSAGKEHALVICNHRSDIDWLVGWITAQVWFSLHSSTLNAIRA
jgi:1-acyl-sn-glycerol-3-phosphate acyltransferase